MSCDGSLMSQVLQWMQLYQLVKDKTRRQNIEYLCMGGAYFCALIWNRLPMS